MEIEEKLDFGYSWAWMWGHGILALVFLAGGVAFMALGAPGWAIALSFLATVWATAGFILTRFVFRAHEPLTLPTDRFLAGGTGSVLDLGCGSGRTSIMVGTARPAAKITGLDNFSAGYISGHGEERLFRNLRIAGVADKITFKQGDMLSLPFEDSSFDAAVSTYALDHLGTKIPTALSETYRVLRTGGEFLLVVILPNFMTALAYLGLVFFAFLSRSKWKDYFRDTGFTIKEEGTNQVGGWFLLQKK